MSKSDDNTNELESYGVWVKNSTGNSDNTETPADPSDELNLDTGSLDLPDFDDSDFSDMFKDEPQGTEAAAMDDFGSEDDTTLSTDELANITDGFEVEQVEAPEENDDLDLGDFDIPDSSEAISDEASEEVSFDEIDDTESPALDETEAPAEESSADDFNFDIDEPAASTETEEEVSIDDFALGSTESSDAVESGDAEAESSGDEEISLDDFMDGGFSDESVAAGNNGYEPGAEPAAASSETEELSLDDFMDGDSFESAPETAKETEVIEDEAPLDMDISFDDSADTVETEDNVSLDISSDDDDADYDTEESETIETEEVSMDDFGSSFTAEESPAPSASSDENINTEDVDLSDFGIDADAEETPIVQDVEEQKNKEKIVDYDLSVGDENTASAPVVNEIKNDTADEQAEEVLPVEATPAQAAENTTAVDNSLLQQIVSELSNLKDEMNKLKSNLEEIKTQDNSVSPAAAAVAAGVAGVAAGAAIASASSESEADEIPEAKDEGGFFSDDDEDETIALSFDELDNIMNTAEFSDTVEAGTAAEEESQVETEVAAEEPLVEENNEEPVIEETSVEEPAVEEVTVDAPAEEEITVDAPVEEDFTNSDDTVIEESIISSEVDTDADSEITVDSEIENAISDETDTSLDDINFEDDQTENFDFSADEKLEEPKIDEFIPDGNDELYENEELPDEISIPKEDDLLVESTSSDFMDSVKETTDDEDTTTEFVADETDEVDSIDLPSELPDSIQEDVEEEAADDDIPTVDKVLGDDTPIENSIDDTFEETSVEEPTIEEETVVEEEPVIEEEAAASPASFAEVDNLDNTLSESNLAYLDKTAADDNSDNIANADLKQDIKSVLLYMDQLLENLPEEKIVEFAKSDEFVTYKKLFSELGLS